MDNHTPLTEALFYILLAVRTPNHGYGIIQDISEMTGGRVTLGPGTLYGAINSMLSKGWIRLYSEDKESRKKKEYLLTGRGVEVFQHEVQRLNELVKNAKKMDEGRN
ncbi:MAG: PadR family transcriptional regulator [Dehalobacter sp. 4CP]|uniref:PadR family transcriptional regulator n=1 Tax=Dehalobacter sp. CP TaxID=2594474 RepID=UPI0013CBE9FB|nr:PadR family transcriptional regulator [Dehalobacter sp. 4CP]